jgi:hypothetical protein
VAKQAQFESKDCYSQTKGGEISYLSVLYPFLDRKEAVISSFLGIEFFNFMLGGWTKAGDTGVALYMSREPKTPFLQKVTK